MTLEYAGTRYSGWQVQQNARTVQGELIRACADALGHPPREIYGSGRTDAGVHALMQVAHLEAVTTLTGDALCRRLNDALPSDIVVLDVAPTDRRFHARHDAVSRAYLYQVSRRRTAFAKPYVWWVKDALDTARMQEAAARLSGFHDFRAFTDDEPGQKSTQVRLERCTISDAGDLVLVQVEASHFLWKMVRRLVGVLVEVGRGGLSPSDVSELLGPSGSRERPARLTAPASGLFLAHVRYGGDAPPGLLGPVTPIGR